VAGIQTIGLGSDNKLSLDTVTKLKDVEFQSTIKPIDSDIEEIAQKKDGLASISSLLETLQASATSLKEDSTYQQRIASVSSDSIGVKIDKGTIPQDFSLEVEKIATEGVVQSKIFSERTSKIIEDGFSEGTLEISIGGETKTFTVSTENETDTLENLMQQINDSSLPVSAKILNTGNGEYRLVVAGDNTGVDNELQITETNLKTGLSDNANRVQTALNAKLKYNGISVYRASNTISDLISGVTLNINEPTTHAIKVSVAEDSDAIITGVASFVDSYNELVTTLDELTKFDDTSKESGIFQGNNDIRSVKREINKILLQMNQDGHSLVEFGIVLNSVGKLEFDQDVFSNKFAEDPTLTESFFKGSSSEIKGETVFSGGVFYKLNNSLESLIGDSGLLTNLKTNFNSQETRLNKEREKAVELLDRRYNRLAEQFAQQDTIINQITQQFASLQMQIDFQTAKS
jgi:flagellar hook-associated protein 2